MSTTVKRINPRAAITEWGAFSIHTYGGTVYAINNRVAIPYRWLTQKALNTHTITALSASTVRQGLTRMSRENSDDIVVVTTYAGNRTTTNRSQEGTWTELPGLQGLYTASAAAIRSRSWTQFTTWIQINNAVLVTTRGNKTPQAAIVPPTWVDERIDNGAPDVAQHTLSWNSRSNLSETVEDVAANHTHYDLQATTGHTVTAVDMEWLYAATNTTTISSTRVLPWSVAHPAVNPATAPQIALVPAELASRLIKGLTPTKLANLPLSKTVDPEKGTQ